ncbi:hypothetical protein VB266_18490 [Enterobacter bugandensis]|jgi:hypothetical protein|uniref:hypothetical protein n=1 Tax=Enterobacter TaxID=547 RepID=UPI001C994DC3|nr:MULTISPECIES: hypothetical protein [Enterobacter]MBY6292466.1 hypothetical protein [Enterobacter bugandensis]MDP9945397.1 hypothetical protein [Enterobacter ludwigii]MEA5167159.1 hypothetical protein [Enterobacter bugandensis]
MDLIYKVLASLGGISFIASGVLAWIGKVYIERYKARLNKKTAEFQSELSATNERIRAKLDNSVYVTKAYFDKELSAYSLIWNSMFETRESVLKLRPAVDQVDPEEPFEERKFRRLKNFAGAFNSFVISVESNKPFIAPEVYKILDSFRKECRSESILFEHGDPELDWVKYWKEAELNRTTISKLFDETCDAIRNRMHTLTVVT